MTLYLLFLTLIAALGPLQFGLHLVCSIVSIALAHSFLTPIG